ncbi:MAG TPA: hypothetical protein GX714_04035 [Chloroflexi bacterium]|nr:hypothetical protein [Chloroflexota bacterium]
MDKYGELADRFHLEPGAAEAARQAAKAGSDAVEARALELVGLGRRLGVAVSMATARGRKIADGRSVYLRWKPAQRFGIR